MSTWDRISELQMQARAARANGDDAVADAYHRQAEAMIDRIMARDEVAA